MQHLRSWNRATLALALALVVGAGCSSNTPTEHADAGADIAPDVRSTPVDTGVDVFVPVDVGTDAGTDAATMDVEDASATDAAVAVPDGSCVPVDAGPPNPELAAAGLALINAANCRQCHGDDLSGNFDGVYFTGHADPAYPPNLTADPATGLGCWTDTQIVNAILTGVDNQGQPICPPMPHWSELGLDTADALAVVAYLRTLPPVTNNVPTGATCNAWGTIGGGCISNADCAGDDGGVCSFQFCEPAPPDSGVTITDASTGIDATMGHRDAGTSTDVGHGDIGTVADGSVVDASIMDD